MADLWLLYWLGAVAPTPHPKRPHYLSLGQGVLPQPSSQASSAAVEHYPLGYLRPVHLR